ncbi:hypothetical protein BDR07DRAFT_1614283 [Suillus spraguei]|nr:hypothetical protein BDR07DRAFT_1614283 [Suillus spraguei]
MSDTTQGTEGRSAAEVEGGIKFLDMHSLTEDELAALMYGISHSLFPLDLPWDPNNALKWPMDLQSSFQCPPIENIIQIPNAADPPDMWYAATYHPCDAPHLRDQYCKITTPPNVSQPQFDGGGAVLEPVPGMVKMVLGVPYIYEVCGDPAKIITVGCAHTPESLQTHPEHVVIHQLVDELQLLTWGDRGLAPGTPAVYKLPEFKRDDRSSRPQEGSYEGSYNLASTVIKGQGQGTLAPAVQTDTWEAQNQISRILKILHDLYGIILPLSVSADEWDVLEYVMAENNVFTFGGGGGGLLKKPLVVLRDPGRE